METKIKLESTQKLTEFVHTRQRTIAMKSEMPGFRRNWMTMYKVFKETVSTVIKAN